jgi:hypothetical protein
MTLKGVALKADLAVIQLSDAFNEIFEGAAQPVKLPDNEGIPWPDVCEGFSKSLPFCLCA